MNTEVNNLKESGDFYIDILGLQEIPVGAGQDPPKRWFKTNNGKEIHLIQSKSEINQLPKSIHMAFSPANFELFIDNLKKNKTNFKFFNYKFSLGSSIHPREFPRSPEDSEIERASKIASIWRLRIFLNSYKQNSKNNYSNNNTMEK